MLNGDDIAKMEAKSKKKRKVKPKISETAPDLIDKLILDFDPETIDIDRRIYQSVTGKQYDYVENIPNDMDIKVDSDSKGEQDSDNDSD